MITLMSGRPTIAEVADALERTNPVLAEEIRTAENPTLRVHRHNADSSWLDRITHGDAIVAVVSWSIYSAYMEQTIDLGATVVQVDRGGLNADGDGESRATMWMLSTAVTDTQGRQLAELAAAGVLPTLIADEEL